MIDQKYIQLNKKIKKSLLEDTFDADYQDIFDYACKAGASYAIFNHFVRANLNGIKRVAINEEGLVIQEEIEAVQVVPPVELSLPIEEEKKTESVNTIDALLWVVVALTVIMLSFILYKFL